MPEMKAGLLIGSQFFGNVHERSDEDWKFEDTPEMRHWLEFHGYKRMFNEYETSPQQEVSFWKHPHYKSEVFLVRNIERTELVRTIIKEAGLFELIENKRNRKLVWFALGTCVESMARIEGRYHAANLTDADVAQKQVEIWEAVMFCLLEMARVAAHEDTKTPAPISSWRKRFGNR